MAREYLSAASLYLFALNNSLPFSFNFGTSSSLSASLNCHESRSYSPSCSIDNISMDRINKENEIEHLND